MSKIQVNQIVNHADDGAPDCPRGLTITGVATATTLDVTGNVSVGGTLTYDDVTNIDSVGIITARGGVNVGPLSGIAVTITSSGEVQATDIIQTDHSASSNAASLFLGRNQNNTTSNDYKFAVKGTGVYVGENVNRSTNSGSNVTLLASGSVGIGTDNPSDDLDIHTSATGQGISLRRTDNTFSTLNFYSNRSDTEAAMGVLRGYWNNTRVCQIALSGGTDTSNKDDGLIQFFTSPNSGSGIVERMRITSGGLMGLGTVSPTINDGTGIHIAGTSAGIKLQNTNDGDWGFIEYADESNTTKYIQGYRDTSGAYAIRPGTSLNATPGITLSSNGFVGINEIAPGAPLTIARSDTSTSGLLGVLKLKNSNSTNGNRASILFSSLNDFDVAAVNGVIETHAGSTSNNEGRLEFWTKASGSDIAERMRLDSAGRLGVGVNNPAYQLDVQDRINVKLDSSNKANISWAGNSTRAEYSNTTGHLSFFTNSAERCYVGYGGGFTILGGGLNLQNGGNLVFNSGTDDRTINCTENVDLSFATHGTNRMTIQGNGKVLVGDLTNYTGNALMRVSFNPSGGGNGTLLAQNTTTNDDATNCLICAKTSTTTTNQARFIQFYAGGQAMGGIVGNGASNVQFSNLSDERSKKNIQPLSSVLERIKKLNVVSFDWKENDEHVNAGFIAQNVETAFPEYVVQNVSQEGEEERKGVAGGMSGGYVAILTKALQEAITKIETLEQRLTDAGL